MPESKNIFYLRGPSIDVFIRCDARRNKRENETGTLTALRVENNISKRHLNDFRKEQSREDERREENN